MKKLIFMVLLILLLSSCHQIVESLYEPVNADDKTMHSIEVKEGDSVGSLAKELSDKGIISNALALRQFMKEEAPEATLQPGKYELSPSMSMKEIVEIITRVTARETVTITFPEGLELREIIAKLQENGLAKDEKKFREVLKNGKFDYPFLEGVDRNYELEGFLFPDTYEFYKDSTDEEIIDKMLANFAEKYDASFQSKAKEMNLTTQQVITLASIIEREAQVDREFPMISSVFHNRIKTNMPLQACSTVQYLLKERKPVLSESDVTIDSPYNTYQNGGLPPAPIASPSLRAIKAALYPADTKYLFFVTKESGDGSHYFAETYEEHLKNVEKGIPNAPESKPQG